MKTSIARHIVCVAVLALVCLAVGLAACGGEEAASPTTMPAMTGQGTTTTIAVAALVIDPFSLYKAKDPFIQQALPPTTTTTRVTTTGTGPTTTGTGTTTTTKSGTTTTTKSSRTTTALHSLKILAIDVVNGVPTVTFEVDSVIFSDKKKGDVASTTWGQIKVVDINAGTQTVILLHGSETRVMQVGQSILK
jgi:hypothetical protein